MKKRIGIAMVLALMLSIVPMIGTKTDASAASKGKYIADLQFSYSNVNGIPSEWRNRVPDSDNWDLVRPDVETDDDVEMEGGNVFAYAKAYVKRTDDPGMALRDIQLLTDKYNTTKKSIKDKNGKKVTYDCVLPYNDIYNQLFTTRKASSGDPICDVFFVRDSLECNGVEYAFNRSSKKDSVQNTSYAARFYELGDEKIPVYTVFLRDNIAKKYISDLMLVKGNDDKAKKEVLCSGYTFIKNIELDGEPYMLGIVRTDDTKEAIRGIYFVKDGDSYTVYTSKSEGAGTAIMDVCPESEMVISGETTVADWTQKYFLGDSFRPFVKSFIEKSDTAYKKNKRSTTYRCDRADVKEYDDLSVFKADMGFEESILEGADVENGSHVSESIVLVRRTGDVATGDIVIDGVAGIGTNDPEKLASYYAQVVPKTEETDTADAEDTEAATEEEVASSETDASVEDSAEAEAAEAEATGEEENATTGTLVSAGKFLWLLIPIALIMVGMVVFMYFKKKNGE